MKRLVLLLSVVACAVVGWRVLTHDPTPRPYQDGASLARRLIQTATASGDVSAHSLSDVVCVAPEGTISPLTRAESLLPGYDIAFLETSETDGLWWLIVADARLKKAWIYGISQTVIHWAVPETARAVDFSKCMSEIRIALDARLPVFVWGN
jgi:hypothetical protein